MLYWLFVLLGGLAAVPVVQEATRTPISKVRPDAPGQLAPLRWGRLHYRWFGPPDGPVAVCIHGLTTSSYVWDGMVPGLVRMGYRVLVFDHYGRGFSDRPRARQDAEFFVAELEALLMHEGIEAPVTLIGYSMGGAVAAAFASQRPAQTARIVLIASAGLHRPSGPLTAFIRHVPVLGDLVFLGLYPSLLRKGIAAERTLPSSVPDIGTRQAAEIDLRGFLPAVLSSFRGILSEPLEDAHRAIRSAGIPLHAIWGEDDALIGPEARENLARWNPDAVQDVIAGGTHAITYSHTGEILTRMRAQAG